MNYDLFFLDENVADDVALFVDHAVMVDTTEKPTTYGIIDVKEKDVLHLLPYLEQNAAGLEVRCSDGGKVVWPNRRVLSLEHALDA